jgi:hypothetical protein
VVVDGLSFPQAVLNIKVGKNITFGQDQPTDIVDIVHMDISNICTV